MNFKKSALASAITLATFATGAAAFDASSWEVSGFVKNETAALQGSGTFIGQATSTTDTSSKNDGGDVIKFENTAKVFVNGDLTENAALHAELNFVYDSEATPNDYQDHMNYSQNDYLRELYVDTMIGDTEVRVGKQQVVWGTADGIKLLDIINPTDYREFAQNTMEDSRIPVWMIKTDTPVGDSGGLQLIVSQAEESKIVGLNASGDQGNPYVMKGVDSITGKVNGFYNIAPKLAGVANTFDKLADAFNFDAGNMLVMFSRASVDGFVNNTGAGANFGGACTSAYYNVSGGSAAGSSRCLAAIAETGYVPDSSYTDANSYATNLIDTHDSSDATSGASAKWNLTNPNSTFEYMPNATFATFNTFDAGGGTTTSTASEYVVDRPDDFSANFGGRFRNSLDNGLNYSVNYFYHYDANPYMTVAWHDASTNEKLTTELRYTESTSPATVGGVAQYDPTGSVVAVDDIPTTFTPSTAVTVLLKNSAGEYYGRRNPDSVGDTLSGYTTNGVKLRFSEKANRVHSLGTSFDYTIDSIEVPVVVRGEFLYDKDVMQPVVDRRALGVGDLEHGLTSQKADFFKYVIGADINVMTNMLVSGQFIQFRNLDYVDQSRTCTTEGSSTFDCSKYTGDMATLHLTNGLQKARENKEFYSLFLSKPFGANQLGRWNNIFIFEEGGGKWNRFDVEYSFSDELVGSFELNNYWGDTNTQFGQMEDSSNIQVGLKYLF